MKKVGITDTILRDAHQSQAATRMRTSEMLEAAEIMNGIGYWSAECWGGATFDACLRFLNEDPWERLRILKEKMPDVRLQMLLRGQNLLGYKQYGDDVVEFFIKKAIENGITVIRMFDALNDTRNLRTCMTAALKYGGWPEAAISYTTSPVHNIDYFVNVSKKLEAMGADTICIGYGEPLCLTRRSTLLKPSNPPFPSRYICIPTIPPERAIWYILKRLKQALTSSIQRFLRLQTAPASPAPSPS